jgi:hypothetical protein
LEKECHAEKQMQPDEILERMSASENNRCLEKETGVVGGVSSLGEGLQKSKIVMMFLEGNSGVS